MLLHSKCNSSSASMLWTTNLFFCMFAFYDCPFCCSFPNGTALLHFHVLLFLFEWNNTSTLFIFAVPFPKERHLRFFCSFSKGTTLLIFAVPFPKERHLCFCCSFSKETTLIVFAVHFSKGTAFAFSHFFVCIFAFLCAFPLLFPTRNTTFWVFLLFLQKNQHFGIIFGSNPSFLLWDYS